jgi:hypothetical protein
MANTITPSHHHTITPSHHHTITHHNAAGDVVNEGMNDEQEQLRWSRTYIHNIHIHTIHFETSKRQKKKKTSNNTRF